MLPKLSAGPSAPATSYIEIHDHSWDTEINMYAGVIGSAVHVAFRRGLAIAAVQARFNLTNKGEKNAGRYIRAIFVKVPGRHPLVESVAV